MFRVGGPGGDAPPRRARPRPAARASAASSPRVDEGRVGIKDQHIAVEAREHALGLPNRMRGARAAAPARRRSPPWAATSGSTCSRPLPTTTTVRCGPSSSTLASKCSSIGRPAIGCSTLCRSDFIRVPLPAARITAAKRSLVMRLIAARAMPRNARVCQSRRLPRWQARRWATNVQESVGCRS